MASFEAVDSSVETASGSYSDADIFIKLPNQPTEKHEKDGWDGGKVEWTDDDDEPPNVTKKRKRKGKGKGKGKGRAKSTQKERPRKRTRKGARPAATPDAPHVLDTDTAIVPSFIRERRQEFDEALRKLGDAGLRLPPDLSDLGLSDSESLQDLVVKPRFSAQSGIKPCRAYRDIEMPGSGGFIPASMAQYLRDYQVAGACFLHRLFVFQRGGVLGDDMGLGKTVQVAAFLTAAYGKTGEERDRARMRQVRRADEGRWYPVTLVICPGSLIANWKSELDRWGWWVVEVFHGTGKADVLRTARAGRLEIMITTYDTCKLNAESINTVQWDCVVADECHRIKDRNSETTRALESINALCRIGLTGTAIQNRYEELWTLLNWTNPGHFGTTSEWNRTISQPLRVGQSHDATLAQLSLARVTAKKLVQNLLPEFLLRRMKTLIADQLPRKTDRVVFCPLTDLQKTAYEEYLSSHDVTIIRTVGQACDCGSGRKKGWCCYEKLSDGRPWLALVFPAMMVLQKLSNHVALLIPSVAEAREKQMAELKHLETCFPDIWRQLYEERERMVFLSNPEFCGKWKILKKLLQFWHGNGDKALVFSHSVKLLRMLQYLFNSTSYNVSYLDGSLSYEDRQRVVDDFNANPCQFVFLISTKAGGVGLNITSANKVVIMDPHWNPSYDLQAQDRAYRIGQIRDVDVFRLISVGTIEEIVYARQIYKQQQANIGYTASSERRYFRGVQEDESRKGEIFGLDNLFSFHGDQPVLRDIVNKTNIAEAKVGVHMIAVDMDKVQEESSLGGTTGAKEHADGEDDDGGLGQLAALVTAENQTEVLERAKAKQPRTDAIQAILTSVGVEYTHDNSEVIGTSRIEAQLSRRAEQAAEANGNSSSANGRGSGSGRYGDSGVDFEGESRLFVGGSSQVCVDDGTSPQGVVFRSRYQYNPPREVRERQFCTMAKESGFEDVTEFALVVESWTQEQRRDFLDKFYRSREEQILEGTVNIGTNKSKSKKAKERPRLPKATSAPTAEAADAYDEEEDDEEL